MIPYGKQDITLDDINAVKDVLLSEYLTQGPAVPHFEATLAKKVGAEYAVAVNSATSALHISCLALGLNKNDWLWTSPISFVASSNCALYCGAKVDFVDINDSTYNLCPIALEKKLKEAAAKGCLPKVVVPVHLCGQSCEMKSIYRLSKQYGFKVIEDASHAVGAKYCDEYIGNCKYSDITIFSFHPVKIITCGEGGVALTNNSQLNQTLNLLRGHGITRDSSKLKNRDEGSWYYEQLSLGYNYRMTDIHAALGLSQLERVDKYVEYRQSMAKMYDAKLADMPIKLPQQEKDTYSSYHLYPILIDFKSLNIDKQEYFNNLRNSGVGVNLHYIPIYKQPYYKSLGFEYNYCSNAEIYYEQTISIPLHQKLSTEEQDLVVNNIKKFLGC